MQTKTNVKYVSQSSSPNRPPPAPTSFNSHPAPTNFNSPHTNARLRLKA